MTSEWQELFHYERSDFLRLEEKKAPLNPQPGQQQHDQVRLTLGNDRPGAVGIVVRNQTVALVRQDRPVIGRALWELPRGMGEPQDSDLTAGALREVREETGISGGQAQYLGTLYADTGLLANPIYVVAMTYESQDSALDQEIEATQWWTLADIDRAIADQTLCDGISLAALNLWRSQGYPHLKA